jgi:hypothetical protein
LSCHSCQVNVTFKRYLAEIATAQGKSMTIRCRTLWLADVQLGTSTSLASELLDFLSAVRPERLYLVGGIVCGHIHRPALRNFNGNVYANDGDWVEHRTALMEDIDGTLTIVSGRNGRMSVMSTEPEKQIAA